MKITDLGEESFVEMLAKRFKVDSPLLGIGDDCAVIPVGESHLDWLVTTDALLEGVHFLPLTISAENLGYKAVMVNASDIAAMGGKPLYAFLSLGIPKSCEKQFLDAFLSGLEEGFRETEVKLMGGDTVSSLSHFFINLTLIGQGPRDKIKKRSMGKVGDIICVDGYLGDSAAGLDLLLHDLNKSRDPKYSSLITAHRRPRAHLAEGEWLGKHSNVHAMMDLSDGLFTDLPRLVRASGCGAHVDLEKMPISPTFKEYCIEQGKEPYRLALEGGEEYCLLFTVDPKEIISLNEAFKTHFGYPFYPIGRLTIEPSITHYFLNGKPSLLKATPFQHFS